MSEDNLLPQGDPLGACRGLASAILITLAIGLIVCMVWVVLHLSHVLP